LTSDKARATRGIENEKKFPRVPLPLGPVQMRMIYLREWRRIEFLLLSVDDRVIPKVDFT